MAEPSTQFDEVSRWKFIGICKNEDNKMLYVHIDFDGKKISCMFHIPTSFENF